MSSRFPSRRALAIALSCVAASIVAASGVTAQDGAVRAGAATITEHDVRQRIDLIADDSMGGRDTPSRGLDLTASYIAREFARMGLRGPLDSGQFIQRYPVGRTRLDAERSRVTFSVGAATVTASAQRDLVYIFGPRTGRAIRAPVVIVGGALQLSAARTLDIEGRILLVAGARGPNATPVNQFLSGAFERNPAAVIMVMDNDTATFAMQVANQFRDRGAVAGEDPTDPVVTMVHERAIGEVLRAAGIDLPTLRSAPTFSVRTLPALTVHVTVADAQGEGPSAPNVVGLLEGSDPELRHEYILFSAHMDHVGTNPAAKGDTIWNGADDDASGTAGVLELAEAFSHPGARPRRSLLFVTVSGEEKGLWGSAYFAANSPVPMSQVVANINMDMIGRNWRDTIVVIGREHSDLGATLDRVSAEHPELDMRAIDDLWPDENFYVRSDHYNFARRGVPVLFFFNGTHKDYHQPSDSPDRIDAEKEARILRLVYYLGQALGNATQRPAWNPDSYKTIVDKRLVP